MKEISLAGAITAIVTPFKGGGQLDFDAMRRLVRRQLDGGIRGIVVCGSTGEAATLDDDEYASIVKFVVEEVSGKIPVIAGAGSNNTKRAIALSEIAKAQGVDALLHVTPFYNKPTPRGLVAHFKAIAEAVDLPIILYNVPGRTGSNVLPSTIMMIVNAVPNVTYVKEASGNIEQIGTLIKDAGERLTVLSGDDALTLAMMKLGARGCISVVSNEAPKQFSELCQNALDGRWDSAHNLHAELLPLMDVNFIESNPIPVKAALSMMGMIENVLRLPLVPLEEKNIPEIKKCLEAANLI